MSVATVSNCEDSDTGLKPDTAVEPTTHKSTHYNSPT